MLSLGIFKSALFVIFILLTNLLLIYCHKKDYVYHTQHLNRKLKNLQKPYASSPIKKSNSQHIIDKIDNFFESEQSYLSSTFSLEILSQNIEIPKHHISQVINQEMKNSFNDLVNQKRVMHVIKLIKQDLDRNKTIEGLALDAGFKSKSTFYTHFKKYTGKTPIQFKNEIS